MDWIYASPYPIVAIFSYEASKEVTEVKRTHKGEALIQQISFLTSRDTRVCVCVCACTHTHTLSLLCPFLSQFSFFHTHTEDRPREDVRETVAVFKPGESPPPETRLAGTLIMDSQPLRETCEESKCILLKPPSLWCLVIVAWAN